MFMLEEMALQKMPKFCNISDLAKFEAFYKVIFIKHKPHIFEEYDMFIYYLRSFWKPQKYLSTMSLYYASINTYLHLYYACSNQFLIIY